MIRERRESEADRLAELAQEEYDARRQREHLLALDFSAEPAWDMLLLLYVEHRRGRPVEIDRLCAASPVAATTALRWVALLVDKRLATRLRSAGTQSRIEIALSASGVDTLDTYLRGRLRNGVRHAG